MNLSIWTLVIALLLHAAGERTKLLPAHLQLSVWLVNMQLEVSRGGETIICDGRDPSFEASGEIACLAVRSVLVAI